MSHTVWMPWLQQVHNSNHHFFKKFAQWEVGLYQSELFFFFRDEFSKIPNSISAESLTQMKRNRIGWGRKGKPALKLTDRSSFMTWLKLAANPGHMREVNIFESRLSHHFEWCRNSQAAWTMPPTLKGKSNTDKLQKLKGGNAPQATVRKEQRFLSTVLWKPLGISALISQVN